MFGIVKNKIYKHKVYVFAKNDMGMPVLKIKTPLQGLLN